MTPTNPVAATTSRLRRAARSALVALLAVSLTVAPASGQSLERAEQEAERLRTDVEVLLVELEDANERLEVAHREVEQLTARRDQLRLDEAEATRELQTQLRTRFKLGTSPTFAMLLTGGAATMGERASLLAVVEARQLGALQQAQGLRGSLDSVEVILADRLQELTALTQELQDREDELSRRLSSAERTVDELRTRKARQSVISRGAQNGTYACILDRGMYHYLNTWGAPRSGGRSHKGTDVMAPRRANAYAFTNGRVERMQPVDRGLGGITLYLRGDDGHRYYYAHLDGFADGMFVGKRVEAGQLVAYVGSSGNAAYSAPHIHFEVHPGGGAAVNPYWWLTPVCP